MKKAIRMGAGLFALSLVFAACGGDDDEEADETTTTEAAADETTTTAAEETTTTEAEPAFAATAEPTEGLTDGQEVSVTASGFSPNQTVGVNLCAQAGDAEVGAEDCDLGGITTIEIGADGTGTGTTTVKSSGIGSNAHDCKAAGVRCFLSVGQLVAGEAERAPDIDLTFA